VKKISIAIATHSNLSTSDSLWSLGHRREKP